MRFRELAVSEMTDAQRAVHRDVCAGPRGRLGVPTNVLLRCAGLAGATQKIGEYVRFKSSLPNRISEFAIMMTARYWTAQYEWHAHCPLAIKAGLSQDVANQLARGKRPEGMRDDESAAYQFCTELHRDKSVSDAAYAAALQQFGENGVVDLIGVSGYYTLISMCLIVNQMTVPSGVPDPLPILDHAHGVLLDTAATAKNAESEENIGPVRLGELREDQMSEAQRAVCRELLSGPGNSISTPMKVLLRSPELARRAQKVSEYLRFEGKLPARLVQFAIVIAARYWRAETMWHSHTLQAIAAGLGATTVSDLAREKRPAGMQADEEVAYQFCTELHGDKNLSDGTFDTAIKQFGEQGTVELIGVSGYYTLAAMALKVARMSLPAGTPSPFAART